LLGWTDQYEDDYYWVIYNNKREVVLSSCVGGFTRLKRKLGGFEYYQIKDIWEMNNPPLSKILEEVRNRGIILK